MKQRSIEDDSNYNIIKKKNSSVASNIIYDLLMKYNGFYKERELDMLPEQEMDSFKKHIEEAHEIVNDNPLLRSSVLQMELVIKESNSSYTKIALDKAELQEELSVCEDLSRSLNREKMMLDYDLKCLQSKYSLLKEQLSEMTYKKETQTKMT